MKSFGSFAVIIFLSTLFSLSCGKTSAPPSSSSAGALTANSALSNAPASPFGRHTLNSGGGAYLNEFIRPEVRARLDEEPAGDGDSGYDPSTADSGKSGEQIEVESGGETPNEEAGQQSGAGDEEGGSTASRLDTVKYSWARKSFGDAVKASPTNNGVIVLYADDSYYDMDRLMAFIEEGRSRIAEASTLPGERIQVVFGGYRAVPQVELWVVPQSAPMPEFKPDDRLRPQAEN